jgi:hypothetical protein
MTDFERGLQRVLEIYQAGVRGEIVPSKKDADARAVYSAGYLDAAAEFDTIQDVSPQITHFLSRYTMTER